MFFRAIRRCVRAGLTIGAVLIFSSTFNFPLAARAQEVAGAAAKAPEQKPGRAHIDEVLKGLNRGRSTGQVAVSPDGKRLAWVEHNDDVWLFLMQFRNPWGHDNKSLLTMYQGATEGGECPLVVDSTTPSCGSSRFGCWVCTVVEKDRSMEAMIKNDEEKVWMTPLLNLRNELDEPDDRYRRDFRRMNGQVQLFHDRTIPGPYKKDWREHWLRRVLDAEKSIRRDGPEDFRHIQLITPDELHEIRRIWLHEKHEFDDSLPKIYEEITGEAFPTLLEDGSPLRSDDWELLRELCNGDQTFFELQVALLGVEQKYRGMSRRVGVIDALMGHLRSGLYHTEEEAVQVLTSREKRKKGLSEAGGRAPEIQQLELFDDERTQTGKSGPEDSL